MHHHLATNLLLRTRPITSTRSLITPLLTQQTSPPVRVLPPLASSISHPLHRATMSTSTTPSPPPKDAARRKASGYPYFLDVQTRWSDNDQYGHINNAVYGHVADAAINAYLIEMCGLQPFKEPTPIAEGSPSPSPPTQQPLALAPSDVLGLMISTSAIFFAPATFPCVLRVGLRVIKLGSSSVLYELGMFEMDHRDVANGQKLHPDTLAGTVTRATHVYVDRVHRRPAKPMPDKIRLGLEKVKVQEFVEGEDRGSKL